MKFSNPFDRRKKTDPIPYSVFPADKTTRTSMDIGRATPVYTIDMVQGNHWKCGVRELTRFMSLAKPLMNDFEVTMGAFFVPYVALDDLTRTTKEFRNFTHFTGDNSLDARKFFNPSSDDVDRVHPLSVPLSVLDGNVNIIGSLADHLGYATFIENVHIDDGVYGYQPHVAGVVLDKTAFSSILYNSSIRVSNSGVWSYVTPTSPVYYGQNGQNRKLEFFMPFDLFVVNMMCQREGINFIDPVKFNSSVKAISATDNLESFMARINDDYESIALRLAELFRDYDNNFWGEDFDDVYVGMTRDSFIQAYETYVVSSVIQTSVIVYQGQQFEANVVRWLAYMRIYGDYFLNELFVSHDDFFDFVSNIYTYRANNLNKTLFDCVSVVSTFAYKSSSVIGVLGEYVSKCECMPVLWEKSSYTARQVIETKGQAPTIQNGDTINVLFYKRMLNKFEDFVARFGTDYKANSQAMYGSHIPDETLCRSQVIGYKNFRVNITAIAQTSASDEKSSLGDFAGYGYSNDSAGSWEWTATEHGLIMILAWIRPRHIAIQSQVDRSILKKSYTDYLLPQFGGVGYQDISSWEYKPSAPVQSRIGCQERYFEYMMLNNESSGLFRTTASRYCLDRATVPVWSEGNGSRQTISSEGYRGLLILPQDDLNRVFVNQYQSPILCQLEFNGTVTRQLPAYIRTDF